MGRQSVYSYGPEAEQHCVLQLPPGGGPHPVMILVHGGFWRSRYSAAINEPVAEHLPELGWASWNVEYRRVECPGWHEWRTTCDDVQRAVETLFELEDDRLDLGRVVCVGHSAGGQLALRAAAASGRRPHLVVALAGVVDLERASRLGLGKGAVDDFMGGPAGRFPERYRAASPKSLVPLGVPQLIVHGARDETVPPELSRSYVSAAAAAGDPVRLVELAGIGHYDFLDPMSPAWEAVLGEVAKLLGETTRL